LAGCTVCGANYHELPAWRMDSGLTLLDAQASKRLCDGGPPAEPTPNWAIACRRDQRRSAREKISPPF